MIAFKYTKTRDNGVQPAGWGQTTYFITFEEANDNEIQTATND